MPSTLLFQTSTFDTGEWRAALDRHLAGLGVDVRVWPDDPGPEADVEYVLIQSVGRFDYGRYPNLKIAFTMGAGADYILSKPELPADVPVVRMVSAGIADGMTRYVHYAVLHFMCGFDRFGANQVVRVWQPIRDAAAAGRRVGVMGLGALGGPVAESLAAAGFAVAGWSARKKAVEGVETFAGIDGLGPFLARTDILACLLPLTEATRDILNADLFARLPEGACVINVARGQHLVEDDLLAGLDSGHLGGAFLDVFRTEPLPPGHPFWDHPKIVVTPHSAAFNDADAAAAHVAANVRRLRDGHSLFPLVDRRRGY